MDQSFFEEIEPTVTRRLERFYGRDTAYQKSVAAEQELFHRLQKLLTEEQLQAVEEYHSALNDTNHIREILAYKQGMKDLASMLDIKD